MNHKIIDALLKLKDYKEEWLDFGIDPINEEMLDRAVEFVKNKEIKETSFLCPPMTRGRFQIELHSRGKVVEIEFDNNKIHYLKYSPDTEEEQIIDCTQENFDLLIDWYYGI